MSELERMTFDEIMATVPLPPDGPEPVCKCGSTEFVTKLYGIHGDEVGDFCKYCGRQVNQ